MSDSQFVSALELATYFNGTTDIAELEPEWIAQADILLQMISADIEAAAGCTFDAGSRTAVLAGSWSRDLELPAGPVSAITAVSLNGTSIGAADYVYNDRGMIRRGALEAWDASEEDYADDWSALGRQGAGWRSGTHWGGPFSTILVAYSSSFAEIPAVVRSLVYRIAARTFGNVANVTQESLAIYSVTYGGNRSGGPDDSGSHVTKAERKRLRSMFNRTAGTFQTAGR